MKDKSYDWQPSTDERGAEKKCHNEDAIIERIKSNPTVQVLMTFDHNGFVDRTTIKDASCAAMYIKSVLTLNSIARRMIKNIDPTDELTFVRMRTNLKEIIISAEVGGCMMVIQNVEPYEPPYRPFKPQQSNDKANGNSAEETEVKQIKVLKDNLNYPYRTIIH